MPEPPPEEQPGEQQTLAQRLAPFKLWQLIVAPIIVLVVGGVLLAILIDSGPEVIVNGRTTSDPASDEPPKNVFEQIERRDIWDSPPQVLKSATTESDDYELYPSVELASGQPVVVTPQELANHGVDYEGRNVVLVGRVIEEVSLDSPYFENGATGLGSEARLAGSNDTTAYIGSDVGSAGGRGDVVYVPGRIAALGTARITNAGLRRAAYFLSLADPETIDPGDDLAESIARAARAARKQPLRD